MERQLAARPAPELEQHFAARLASEVKAGHELAQHSCNMQLRACERPAAAVLLQLLQRSLREALHRAPAYFLPSR